MRTHLLSFSFYIPPPSVSWSFFLPLPLWVPCQSLSSDAFFWLPQGMTYPFPLPHFYVFLHWSLASSVPQFLICDSIWIRIKLYTYNIIIDKNIFPSVPGFKEDNSCSCHNYSCECCLHAEVKRIYLNDTGKNNVFIEINSYVLYFVQIFLFVSSLFDYLNIILPADRFLEKSQNSQQK